MLLSIVIPHYNLPREMLKRCIDSIIEQALPNGTYEIIIIDDGSEEQPLWLCNEYKNYNIKLINKNHEGLDMPATGVLKRPKENTYSSSMPMTIFFQTEICCNA